MRGFPARAAPPLPPLLLLLGLCSGTSFPGNVNIGEWGSGLMPDPAVRSGPELTEVSGLPRAKRRVPVPVRFR